MKDSLADRQVADPYSLDVVFVGRNVTIDFLVVSSGSFCWLFAVVQ